MKKVLSTLFTIFLVSISFLAFSQNPKPTPNKDHPNSGQASPKGNTQAERDKSLREQSQSHPDSYKDTKEYKGASSEKQKEVDKAVERNNQGLREIKEKMDREKADKEKADKADKPERPIREHREPRDEK